MGTATNDLSTIPTSSPSACLYASIPGGAKNDSNNMDYRSGTSTEPQSILPDKDSSKELSGIASGMKHTL